nr:type IV pilus modification protein PilV [uncultured Halomonas sp.]
MNSQRGFSLIEALIALVVLSIGLIGVAAMQLKALQSATAGYQRSVATLAAVDAQERLWAELAQLTDCSVVTPQQARAPSSESVEEQWKNWWRDDDASNPLRSVNWENSSIEPSPTVDCQFTITIDLGEGPGDIDDDVFTYTFRLPEKS